MKRKAVNGSMCLSDNIIRYRAKHDLSQEQMAKKCGITKLTIFNIEHGKQTPTPKTEMKIRMVLEED